MPLALFSRGVAFDLKRRRRHAALHESRHQLGGMPGPRERGGTWQRPRWRTCSRPLTILTSVRDIPSSELRAVPLPSSGRTHLTVRLTVGDPASSPVSGLDMASSAGMSTWK